MEPVRTCIGCRANGPRSSLTRVFASDGSVVADCSATRSGRGAWIHLTVSCVETAIKRRAFGRALRVSTPLDTEGLLAVLAEHHKEHRVVIHNEQAD
jgi:predicted RNA-binding protein YlxR (DUF448 family)